MRNLMTMALVAALAAAVGAGQAFGQEEMAFPEGPAVEAPEEVGGAATPAVGPPWAQPGETWGPGPMAQRGPGAGALGQAGPGQGAAGMGMRPAGRRFGQFAQTRGNMMARQGPGIMNRRPGAGQAFGRAGAGPMAGRGHAIRQRLMAGGASGFGPGQATARQRAGFGAGQGAWAQGVGTPPGRGQLGRGMMRGQASGAQRMRGGNQARGGMALGAGNRRRALGLLQQIAPEKAKELAQLRRADPEAFRAKAQELRRGIGNRNAPKAIERLRRAAPGVAQQLQGGRQRRFGAGRPGAVQEPGKGAELERLRKRDPEFAELVTRRAKLGRQTREMGRQYAEAPPQGQAEIREHLRDVLTQLFDTRTEMTERETEKVRDRLAELEDSIATRREHKADLIEQKLSEITGKSEAYAW